MKVLLLATALTVLTPFASFAQESDTRGEIRELREKLERLERKLAADEAVREKKAAEERAAITETVKKDVISEVSAKGQSYFSKLVDQTKIGAYGSIRYGTSSLDDLHNTFTFRRFVLTTDSPIAERLRAYLELEFERFTELELERRTFPTAGGLRVEQAIEGSNKSEISLEQAWMQYDIADWLKFRGGAVLVPLGRFNINHDDNRWDLPRRSLVDRGVPVLLSTSAWDELGFGFLGDVSLTENALLNYQVFVMNGVSLDSEFEEIAQTRDPRRDKVAFEVELSPSTGSFASDVKDSKAVAGRLALSPALGHEIA